MTALMAGDVVATGTYWDQRSWDLARSAYIADLDTDPQGPDAFIGWLHQVLEEHARRSPEQRAELAAAHVLTRSDRQRGFGKAFPLRRSVVEALERAVVDDRQQLGRVVSRTAFVREAVVIAAARARDRYGRDLPPPPARLPTRPPRRALARDEDR